jgi:hypothetical protein
LFTFNYTGLIEFLARSSSNPGSCVSAGCDPGLIRPEDTRPVSKGPVEVILSKGEAEMAVPFCDRGLAAGNIAFESCFA